MGRQRLPTSIFSKAIGLSDRQLAGSRLAALAWISPQFSEKVRKLLEVRPPLPIPKYWGGGMSDGGFTSCLMIRQLLSILMP